MSSWLKFKKLVPQTKVWKALKNKLPIKRHKLERSRAIKKSYKNRPHKKLSWPSLSIQPKKFKNIKPDYQHTLIQKKRKPVSIFVDQLLVEPAVAVVEEHVNLNPPGAAADDVGAAIASKEQSCSLKINGPDRYQNMNDISADDMWESMELMHGIDKRAEEFIARFRAEMQQQEMLARCL